MNTSWSKQLEFALQFIGKIDLRRASLRMTFVGLATFLAACGDIRVSPAEEMKLNVKTDALVCTEDPLVIGRYSKIMFIIDKSGSNNDTDPDLQNGRRITAIRDFFEKNKSNKYIKWGFINFNQNGAQSYIPDQEGPDRIFTTDTALFEQAMAQFSAEADAGGTPYRAALQLTTSAVREEIKADNAAGITANFNLIFITDGVPTDYTSDDQFHSDVEALAALSPGNIHFSTVYYGPEDAAAQNRLRKAAEKGLGNYQDTNTDPLLKIDDLLVGGTSNEPYVIKNFVVYNMNSAPCDDGSMGGDSDADGLCDKDEEKYNKQFANDPEKKARMGGKTFDPANRNSFNPYINDGIYYRHIVFNENVNKDCSVDKDGDFDLINDCEEKFMFNKDAQGPTVTWTNEMLKKNKNAYEDYFDSDGDGLLDGLEFIFFRNAGGKSTPMNFNNIFDRSNGYQMDYLFNNHMNPLNPASTNGYGIQFFRVEPNGTGQNCYSYHQNELPLYFTKPVSAFQASGSVDLAHVENENVVLIYYIQTPEYSPNSRGFLRFSFQKLVKDKNTAQDISVDTKKFYIWPKPVAPE